MNCPYERVGGGAPTLCSNSGRHMGLPLRNGNSGDVGVVRGRKALRPYNHLTGCSVHGSTVLRQAQDRAHHEREDKGHSLTEADAPTEIDDEIATP